MLVVVGVVVSLTVLANMLLELRVAIALRALLRVVVLIDAYSGDSRSPIPMISVHSVDDLLYRRQS